MLESRKVKKVKEVKEKPESTITRSKTPKPKVAPGTDLKLRP